MFLTDDELFELTGYRQASKQIAMLIKQGVPFHINAANHPKVARAVIEGKHAKPTETVKQVKAKEPKWAALLP